MANAIRTEQPGETRFGLRVTALENGNFTFTTLVTENGKQLGNSTLTRARARRIAQFILDNS